jgi:DNA-binding SARP family transcriptional activator/class 3 adenylate cyclase/pimeloyl-ACP methyl ester carboxylesterase
MDFRLLGPLEVHDGEVPIGLGGAKQRALLALLLLNANRTVASDRLVDDLWGERVPESARKMVQIHVHQLRKLLPPQVLRTHASGYSIEVGPDELDMARFERLATEGRRALAAGDPDRASERLRSALALWRGPALAEFDEPFAAAEGGRLEEVRLAVLEDRIEADLQLGRHADLTAELESLVQRHPQRERLRGQQMLALYRSGRQADALATYRDGSRVLDEELGLQPSAALRELEAQILRQDASLAAPSRSAPTVPPSPIPRPQAVTRYAMDGDISLAYQVFGEGELELALVTGWVLPMELSWDDPAYVRFLERLGSFSRVLLWDKRGTGLSDRLAPGELPTIADHVRDLTTVIEAAGFARPAVFGLSEGSLPASVMAAEHPERTRALVLYGGWARTMAAPDYPWGDTPEMQERLVGLVRRHWGDAGPLLRYWAAELEDDEPLRAWWGRALRLGASPTAAIRWLEMMVDFDIRDLLPSIHVPTLVMHRRDDPIVQVGNGRYLAEHIPEAEYVEIPGANHLWWVGDHDQLLDPLERFLTGAAPARMPERVLTTVLFTDIVDSTQRGSEIGDRRWRDLLAQHDRAIRAELERNGGREVKTTGDGFLATFDAPTRAVRCGAAIRDAGAALGLDLRVGVHTGECERVDGDITGIAVNVAARVCGLAGPGEVLVSRTVTDLVAGSNLRFEPRGEHELAGLPGAFALFAMSR